MFDQLINYLRYSGVSVVFSLNPLHWKILPWYRNEATEEVWSTNSHVIGFLFLSVRVWIDNGDW